jgi:hypothetical protein
MFKTNTYFDEQVVSITFKNNEGTATVGVMAQGEYTFGTSTIEIMTVISGEMQIQLKGKKEWKSYKAYESFEVAANGSFNVKVTTDTSYKCVCQ